MIISFAARGWKAGFTLVELMCVLTMIILLAALLLPLLALGKSRAKRLVCMNNERQEGMAFHMFLHDHDNRFPMAVPVSDGGSAEIVDNGQPDSPPSYLLYRHFQVLSNYSAVTRELVCPADHRWPAANMGSLDNSHLSYFVGVNADYNDPNSILAGDRNMSSPSVDVPSRQFFEPGSRLHWTRELHHYKGDVLFADGHVELWNQITLAADLHGRKERAIFVLPALSPSSPAGETNVNDPALTMPSAK